MDYASNTPAKKKILILEEGHLLSQLFNHALKEDGFDPIVTQDIHNVRGLIIREDPQVIIASGSQTDVDPLEHVKSIREMGTDLPILVSLYKTDDKTILAALDAGATDFIRIPINWGILKHKLLRCLKENKLNKIVNASTTRTIHEIVKAKIQPEAGSTVSLFLIADQDGRVDDLNRVFTLRDEFRARILDPEHLDSCADYMLHVSSDRDAATNAKELYHTLTQAISVFRIYTIQQCSFDINAGNSSELMALVEKALHTINTMSRDHNQFNYIGQNGQMNDYSLDISA